MSGSTPAPGSKPRGKAPKTKGVRPVMSTPEWHAHLHKKKMEKRAAVRRKNMRASRGGKNGGGAHKLAASAPPPTLTKTGKRWGRPPGNVPFDRAKWMREYMVKYRAKQKENDNAAGEDARKDQ